MTSRGYGTAPAGATPVEVLGRALLTPSGAQGRGPPGPFGAPGRLAKSRMQSFGEWPRGYQDPPLA